MKLLIIPLSLILLAQAPRQDMSKWTGKYPDAKFFNQLAIKTPLRRILSKQDYDSIRNYNLMIPIKQMGDYLVTYATVKYSDPQDSVSVVYNLKDKSVYVIFWEGDKHRKFSTKNNQFNLPDEVLKEIGLKEE
jgi:hypothetical protein